jgi:hypothetical protein
LEEVYDEDLSGFEDFIIRLSLSSSIPVLG